MFRLGSQGFFWHSSRVIPRRNPVARGKNPIRTEELTLGINSQTGWYLDRLVETGLFGNARTEAAKIVIYDHCKLLIAQGKLQMAPPLPGSAAVSVASESGK
jgi:hypothetical protein